jgi:hypothetical protein
VESRWSMVKARPLGDGRRRETGDGDGSFERALVSSSVRTVTSLSAQHVIPPKRGCLVCLALFGSGVRSKATRKASARHHRSQRSGQSLVCRRWSVVLLFLGEVYRRHAPLAPLPLDVIAVGETSRETRDESR